MASPYILLTGATGNLGAVILEQLIATGQSVNAVLRSFTKSKAFLESKYPEAISSGKLTFTEIPDMAVADVFHAPVANASSIIHVATPIAYSDLLNSMIEPAWKFNENVLNAAAASPTVKRVLITGSVVSTMRVPEDVATDRTFTEADYNPITLTEALEHPSRAYQYSKTLSEQKSWALGGIARVVRYLFAAVDRTFYFPYFIAFCAGNERYMINNGLLYLNRIANQLRDKYPELRSRIAPGAENEGFPDAMAKFDISKMERVFGTDWISGFESVEAIVKDVLAYEATQ